MAWWPCARQAQLLSGVHRTTDTRAHDLGEALDLAWWAFWKAAGEDFAGWIGQRHGRGTAADRHLAILAGAFRKLDAIAVLTARCYRHPSSASDPSRSTAEPLPRRAPRRSW